MKQFIFSIIATLLAITAMSGRAADDAAVQSRKASYTFLEALRQRELGNMDAFFELTRRAALLDTSNSVAAYYLGFCYLTMDGAPKELAEEGYQLMRKHYLASPGDYDETLVFANVASRMGHFDEAIAAFDTLVALYPDKLEARTMLASAYAYNGRYREAIATYDSLEVFEGKSFALSLRKIQYYMAMNDTTGTLAEARELYATAPDNASFNLLMGNILVQLGQPDSSMHYLDRAQQLDPDNGTSYLIKAQIYNEMGDSAQYDQQIYRALTSKDFEVEGKVSVLTDYIRQALAERDSSQRVNNLFQVLLEQHPHESAIHDLYSSYFITQHDYARAAEQMGYVTDTDPTNAVAWGRLIALYYMANDYEQAAEAAQRALEYNPDNIELYETAAATAYQMKQYDQAIDIYQRALAVADSTDYLQRAQFLGGMGDVYGATNDTIRARQCYDEALRLDPGNTLIMNNYAYFLAVRNIDLDQAERLSAIAVKEDPDNPTVIDTYAWVYFRKKEYKLALAYIEKAIAHCDEENAEILEHYGDILFMNGQFDEAVEQWEKALELNPDSEVLQRKVTNKAYFNE